MSATLAEAVAELEKRLPCEDGPAGARDPEGGLYIVIRSGGMPTDYRDRQTIPVLCLTPEIAAAHWIGEMLSWLPPLDQQPHRLYWRVRPEMQEISVYMRDDPVRPGELVERKWYSVYSRFQIEPLRRVAA